MPVHMCEHAHVAGRIDELKRAAVRPPGRSPSATTEGLVDARGNHGGFCLHVNRRVRAVGSGEQLQGL